MKVIYVAGPFRASNSWAVEQNVRQAEALALEVWRLGAACICPHANTRFYQGAAPDACWLEGDLAILRRCDAVLMTPNWGCSIGARDEHWEATRYGIRVFYDLETLAQWLKETL